MHSWSILSVFSRVGEDHFHLINLIIEWIFRLVQTVFIEKSNYLYETNKKRKNLWLKFWNPFSSNWGFLFLNFKSLNEFWLLSPCYGFSDFVTYGAIFVGWIPSWRRLSISTIIHGRLFSSFFSLKKKQLKINMKSMENWRKWFSTLLKNNEWCRIKLSRGFMIYATTCNFYCVWKFVFIQSCWIKQDWDCF